ncbi:MAG TPA: SDR family oxidoreductase, partial [bacterium]|nr:SDR family oxidoreductase [bacterium]
YMDTPVALITGSGKRLGRKMALALAEAGYDIIINYHQSANDARKLEKLIRQIGRQTAVIKADVRRSDHVKKMFKEAIKKFGKIDVLINNAAIFPKKTELPNIPESIWDDVIDSNLKSSFLCAQEAAKYMLRQKSGKIINIASLGAFLSWKNYIPYNVSKAGVVMLTRSLAKALAPDITVNAVAPGTIIVPEEEVLSEHLPTMDRIPMKKYGKPADITAAVLFLLQNEYITGQIVGVDGGATIP